LVFRTNKPEQAEGGMTQFGRALPRKKVTVYDFPDGRIEVRHQGLALPYRTFDRITRVDQGAIVGKKRLSEALKLCRVMQAELPPKLRESEGSSADRPGRAHVSGEPVTRSNDLMLW
jgi:hypothetical protein